MLPLVGLPRTANVKSKQTSDLVIENHKVLYKDGLFSWLSFVITWADWDVVIPQLLSQGFKFDAVRDQCIKDIKDPEKLTRILYYMDIRCLASLDDVKKFTATKHTAEIILLIESKLKSCRNWTEFHREFKRDGDFKEKLSEIFKRQLVLFKSDQTRYY